MVVMLFSGGIDSLAALYAIKKDWDKTVVLWVNSGDVFPETVKQMEAMKTQFNFIEVNANQPDDIKAFGYPADVQSAWSSVIGKSFRGTEEVFQSPLECCAKNLWKPAHAVIKQLGATMVVTGQRSEDKNLSQVKSREVLDGIEYFYPIEQWSRDEVLDFLKLEGVELPDNYKTMDTSLDCMHCTAFINKSKVEYLKRNHVKAYEIVSKQISLIIESAESELRILREHYGLLHATH